jgi:hypothetical protein
MDTSVQRVPGTNDPRSSAEDTSKSSDAASPNSQATPLSEAMVRPEKKKSGGPRTAMGKARSRMNAFKHGIFSDVILREDGSPPEFQVLLQGLRSELNPQGVLESILVEKLATLIWRLRRLLELDNAIMAQVLSCAKQPEDTCLESSGTTYTLRIESPERAEKIRKILEAERLKDLNDPRYLKRLQEHFDQQGYRLQSILRYEASLERAFDRTLSQLERLQRIRLGEFVPPEHRVRFTQEP